MSGNVVVMTLVDCLEVEEVDRWIVVCREAFSFPTHAGNIICSQEGC